METDSQQAPADMQSLVQNIESEISRFQSLVANEDDKMIRYKVRVFLFQRAISYVAVMRLNKSCSYFESTLRNQSK